MKLSHLAVLLVVSLAGCPMVAEPEDAGVVDAGVVDAGVVDAGVVDAGVVDAGVVDAGVVDAGVVDAGVVDAGVVDAGVVDAGVVDAGVIDAGAPGAGRIEGIVTEALTRAPLVGATVEAGGRSTTTGAGGAFALTQLTVGVPLQLRVRGPQGAVHSTTQREVIAPPTGAAFITAELLPGCSAQVNLSTGPGVIAPRGCASIDARVGLTLPQGGVVDALGAPVTDVRVELAVLPVALGGRAASDALAAFPGDMQALTTTGASVFLESRGAVEVRLTHPVTGAPLQLATGSTAVVTFSAAEASFDEATVPAWHFDEAQGRWVEEGATTLVADSLTGAMLHRLEVSHFTFWNADQPTTRTCVSGRLTSSDGGVLASTQVSTTGRDYIGHSATLSASDGRFSAFARRSSEVDLVGAASLGATRVERRLRVRTNPDATCVDVGDVALDTAPLFACAAGRVVDPGGQPLAGVDVFGQSASRLTQTVSASDGTFCLPMAANERFELALSGVVNGVPVRGRRTALGPLSGGGACGATGCAALGDVQATALTCLSGRVLDGAGVVSNAHVHASGPLLTFARSSLTGTYCLPVEQSALLDLSAYSPAQTSMGTVPRHAVSSGAAACGSSGCEQVDVVLADAACVRGVVTEAGGAPLEGVRVTVSPVGGTRVRTVFTGAGGAFCAPMTAGTSADLEFSMSRPGTRFFATSRVAAPVGPASCGSAGCTDAGVVSLVGVSFSGCVKGRLGDGSRPFSGRVDVLNGNRVAILRPREDGSFCVEIPVASSLALVDPEPRSNCARLRTAPVDVAALAPGSCADEATCLEAGDLDFAAFCATS